MEEILAMVDGMAGEDGKVEAAALKEALKGRLSDLQKSLQEKEGTPEPQRSAGEK